jgi:methionyl-tRNA formyltransferase
VSRIRILFLGTPDFAVPALQSLLTDDHFEVVGIVSQPDRPVGRKQEILPTPVKEVALKAGIRVFQPEKVSQPEIIEELKLLKPEAAVVVAFGQILSNEFLNLFPLKAVNLHASLLPRWRGAAPIQRALIAGDEESGVTLQVVVPALDAGPIVGVRKVKIHSEMDAGELYESLRQLGPQLLRTELMDYLRGNLSALEQDVSQVTIAKKIKKGEGAIDWAKSAKEIHQLFRGLKTWPGVWCTRDSKSLKFHQVAVQEKNGAGAKPGTVLAAGADGILVACGAGSLLLKEVQPESKKSMLAASYLQGHPLKVEDVLENGTYEEKR